MELVGHPLVAGPGKRAGLFWFSILPLFTNPTADSHFPIYLDRPESSFEPIWALPDHSLHALSRCRKHPLRILPRVPRRTIGLWVIAEDPTGDRILE